MSYFKETAGSLFAFCLEHSNPICLNSKLESGLDHKTYFPRGVLTEISAYPGSCQSKLCFQICVKGATVGKVLYMDVKQEFSAKLFKEVTKEELGKDRDLMNKTNVKAILKRVLVETVTEPDEFVAKVCSLDGVLKGEETVSLVVINSFPLFTKFYKNNDETQPFKHTIVVTELLNHLQKLALKFNVAVVLVNDFTTSFKSNKYNFTPSLGNALYHTVSQRLMISRKPKSGNVYLTLEKSILRRSRTLEIQL